MTTTLVVQQQALILAALLAFNVLAFKKGDEVHRVLFWVFAGVGDIIIGFNFAAGTAQYSSQWVIGILIVCVGLYCITHFLTWAVGLWRKSRGKPEDKKEVS
jgi:hypothetical protein